MKALYKAWAEITGKNPESMPIDVIKDQLFEPRALPMGMTEFHEWADRLIAGAAIPCEPGQEEVFVRSQKYVLAQMIMQLGPTESHKPDAHFIHSLRKVACNQVADTVRQEIYAEKQKKIAEEEAAKNVIPMKKESDHVAQ